VKIARALPSLPVVAEALEAGPVSFEEVGLFARARVPATAAAMERDEATLVEVAATMRVDDVAGWCRGGGHGRRRRHRAAGPGTARRGAAR
jgi:hypothetical protein